MKKIVAIIVFLGVAFTSFSQDFADTIELNQYIRDTIKDRRPDRINALQVQKALLGLSKFLGTASIDLNALHADVQFNFDSTKYLYYNVHGDLIDSTTFPHTDIYPVNIRQRDTLATAVVLEAGRLDSTWLSDDGYTRYNLYMSGALDSNVLAVDTADSSGAGSSNASSGTFTSTGLAILNVASTSAAPALYWTKVDNIVHASVSGNIQPTATGAAHIKITLPSATSLPNGSVLGMATIAENGGTVVAAGYVFVASSTTATMRFIATYASTGTYFITLDYPE